MKKAWYNDIMHVLTKEEVIKIKIAIISDVHGNSIALREVLKSAEKNNVDEYVFLGDLINDFPMGNETLELVKSRTQYVLRGNKEQYLIELEDEKYDWPNVQFKNTLFMLNELTDENKEYIRHLPISMSLDFDGYKILFCHGSPTSVEELLYVDNNEILDHYTKELKEDALIFGHTHERMWERYINNKLVINAGCCGVCPYYIGVAEYVILTIEHGEMLQVEFKRVKYDINEVKEAVIKSGILEQDKVLMNLTYGSISGHGIMRHKFLSECKNEMIKRRGKTFLDGAKGIYTYFKLYDDDIWLGMVDKFKNEFTFK